MEQRKGVHPGRTAREDSERQEQQRGGCGWGKIKMPIENMDSGVSWKIIPIHSCLSFDPLIFYYQAAYEPIVSPGSLPVCLSIDQRPAPETRRLLVLSCVSIGPLNRMNPVWPSTCIGPVRNPKDQPHYYCEGYAWNMHWFVSKMWITTQAGFLWDETQEQGLHVCLWGLRLLPTSQRHADWSRVHRWL